jgi:hypothetical protein
MSTSGDRNAEAIASATANISTGQHNAIHRKRAAHRRPFFVDLPGIEPAAKNRLTCGDIGSDDAKFRETTRNDLRKRERR